VVGGSEGGIGFAEPRAALLASHGYAALALAYFALEHLPGELVNIPLEYFETALHWLQRQPTIRGDQLAVMGGSKGGELGLLLGTLYPQLKAVIVYVPSGVVWNGVFRGKEDPDQLASSWSWRGKPLPYVSRAPMHSLQEQIERDEAISLLPLYYAALTDTVTVQQAMIPVEKTQGAILLISGGDDQFWPSSLFSAMVVERLRQHDYAHLFQHLQYPHAGHGIGLPHLPATVNQLRHPIRGLRLRSGGTARENAHARVDAWARTLEFLQENLAL
jgi:dienelactone hydrolase